MSTPSTTNAAAKAFIRQQIEVHAKAHKYWPMPAHTVNFMVADVERKLGEAIGKIITPGYIKTAFSKAEPAPDAPPTKA